MDRNLSLHPNNRRRLLSLSARRAWIEMLIGVNDALGFGVALRKESVDRNFIIKLEETKEWRRSPQGERG